MPYVNNIGLAVVVMRNARKAFDSTRERPLWLSPKLREDLINGSTVGLSPNV